MSAKYQSQIGAAKKAVEAALRVSFPRVKFSVTINEKKNIYSAGISWDDTNINRTNVARIANDALKPFNNVAV